MWILLLGSVSCLCITLIFSILAAGQRADEGEERILKIISPTAERNVAMQQGHASRPMADISVG
jgi:hypothetical protein